MSASTRTLSTFSLVRGPPASPLCVPAELGTQEPTQLTDRSPLLGSAGLLFLPPGSSTPPATSPQRTILTSPISTFGSTVISLPRTPVRYSLTTGRPNGRADQFPPPPVFTMSNSPSPLENRLGTEGGNQTVNSQPRQRGSPLNSVYWLALELLVTLAQIISSVVVLLVSTNEHPKVPLGVSGILPGAPSWRQVGHPSTYLDVLLP
jgi:hypothetical protein